MACARASHAHELYQKCLQVAQSSLQGGRRASSAGTGAKGGTIAFGRREDAPARVHVPSGATPASSAKASVQKQPSRVPKAPQPSTQNTGMLFILTVTQSHAAMASAMVCSREHAANDNVYSS